jgi:glycopeptide antibiotics resistance protein
VTTTSDQPLQRLRQPASGERTSQPANARSWLLIAAVFYLVFVIYGSLVPLRYQALPWDQAVARFLAMPYLALGIGSRADWVANLLLFIPLSFLWAGVFWPRRRPGWRLVVAPVLFFLAFGLSCAIEFVQLYFPQRTVSINDVAAETVGAAIGIGLWWALGHHVTAWLQSLAATRGTTSVAQRLLTVYLLVLLGYNLMPLDLTISPVEVYHKWAEGKVVLLPFSAHYESLAQAVYGLLTDIAIWVPAAALWRLARYRSGLQAWTATVTAATVIEILQLFVYSRVSDSTDIFTAAIGAAVGVYLVRSSVTSRTGRTPQRVGGSGARVLAVLVWMLVLMAVFWYPFDFNFDRSFLRERLAGAQRVPFEAYYFGSEFRAVTEVLHKMLFFAPLGFVLYRLAARLPGTVARALVHAGVLLLVFSAAAAIELAQVALPGKNADVTDLALEFLGAVMGYFGSLLVVKRLEADSPRRYR